MRFAAFQMNGVQGVAVANEDGVFSGLLPDDPDFPGSLDNLVVRGASELRSAARRIEKGHLVDLEQVVGLPVISKSSKIICVGLNYVDHTAESGFQQPDYPTFFIRFNSSLIGHRAPIVRPRQSVQLDYEGELVAVIGKGGKNIPREQALDHVIGYSIFNDASIRDYQFKSPQWTIGKNFDSTGAFGPVLVTPDELPLGCRGLVLETKLNGETVQRAAIDDMIFDVASLISIFSEAVTLSPGDVFVTGTPSGVGLARKPPLWMKAGDVCEVAIDQIGVLRNPIVDECFSLDALSSDGRAIRVSQ